MSKFRLHQVVWNSRYQCYGKLMERGRETLKEGRLWRMLYANAPRWDEWVVEKDLRNLNKRERWVKP